MKNYNSQNLPESLDISKLKITYEQEVGIISLTVNYFHEDVFALNTNFSNINNSNKSIFGSGISLLFLNKIFNVLQDYKFNIAMLYRESRFMDFFLGVTLQKANGDYVSFIAEPSNRGYIISSYAFLSIDNQEYEVFSPNSRLFSQNSFFKYGKKADLNNQRTGFYYFDRFFSNELKKESKFENTVENRKRVENYVGNAEQIMAEIDKREELFREENNNIQKNSFAENQRVYRVEFKLSNRSAVYMDRPYCSTDRSGIIIVQITVDQNGNVTEAVPGIEGTTIQNSECWEAAKRASLNAEFNKDKNAPAFQQGSITFRLGY